MPGPDHGLYLLLALVTGGLFAPLLFIARHSQGRRAREMLAPECACPHASVRYVAWSGSVHTFDVANDRCAERFVEANRKKMIGRVAHARYPDPRVAAASYNAGVLAMVIGLVWVMNARDPVQPARTVTLPSTPPSVASFGPVSVPVAANAGTAHHHALHPAASEHVHHAAARDR